MKFIKWFEDVTIKDVSLVGGKNASLGEMIGSLSSKGVMVPGGFAVTADGYRYYLSENHLDEKINSLLLNLDKNNLKELSSIGSSVRALILNASFPEALQKEITESYQELCKKYGQDCDVAVRSSGTAEDLPEASFAGQQETFLGVRGVEKLIDSCKKSFASLFTDRAISYRIDHSFGYLSIALSIGIQKMVRSDKACAGVIFTLDTETGFRNVIMINSSYGLGESVVSGKVNPDEFYVHKETLLNGYKPILKKRLGDKSNKIVYSQDGTVTEDVTLEEQQKFSLTDDEILQLSKYALIIEDHYSKKYDRWMPMDIEWAKDGVDQKLYIVQARPETVHARQENNILESYELLEEGKVLIEGRAVGRKIVSGKAKVIDSPENIGEVKKGDILVTDMTDPDWEPIMKLASGIITNRGGRTCHAAIVSRELGIPAIVGTSNVTSVIKSGQSITMDCSGGEVGTVYEGELKFKLNKVVLDKLPKLKTKIMMNVGNPNEAFGFAMIPNDGVGLARLEFIINNSIYIHPMALVHPEIVKDEKVLDKIEKLTFGYTDKKRFFIDKLAQEAGTIAAAFYPKPVIIRMSDFKSNEYRKLIGGEFFEPEEENPMIGFRGASRYYNDKYREAFALECIAVRKIREEMGFSNVKIMIPFVRTVTEGETVIAELEKNGLKRSKDLEIIMMCEIPSNVILLDEFCKVFDGFSIGSNDLTQMTLAIDRDSNLVAQLFDERNEAVKKMIKLAIDGAKRNNKPIGICGQAPSDYPEIAKFLIKCGIDSMSLNPDTVLSTMMMLSS